MNNKTIKAGIPIALAGLLLSSCASTTGGGWSELTDSMDAWHTVGDANWHWEGNELVADEASGASHLVTDESFTDFQIQLEFWNHEGANSGVFMRIQNPESISVPPPTRRTSTTTVPTRAAAPAAFPISCLPKRCWIPGTSGTPTTSRWKVTISWST